MSYDPNDTDPTNPGPDATGADPSDSNPTGTATLPPPPAPTPPPRRLVRDPFSRLGGVASGLGHHYGIDVSVVRILFVLATLASGFGLLVYLLAWLVIPRAEHWPPAGPVKPLRSLSGRDLGIALAVIGVMVALGFGAAGATGSILIPLVLVGGGVWLLVQPPAEETAGAAAPTFTDDPVDEPMGYAATGPVGAPVPPRSRKRRFAVLGVVLAVIGTFVIIPLVLFGLVIAAVATGDFDVDFDTTRIEVAPVSVGELPLSIIEDEADLTIDLSSLDAADFADATEPFDIDAQVEFGKITVIVPDDVDVAVDASTDVGKVTVFETNDDGFDNAVVTAADGETDLILDLEVNVGEITVERE